MVRSDSEPLGPFVQVDEALVGGKGGPHKELVLVAAEANGRVRLAHVDNNDKGTVKRFADGQIAADAHVVTDGHAGYDAKSLGKRPHDAVVQTKAERRENDAVQGCHWTISLLKRWLIGTHAGAVRDKHLQGYLDEFAFRHNRRKTNGVGRIAARVIEKLVAHPPRTMRQIIDEPGAAHGLHQIRRRQPELRGEAWVARPRGPARQRRSARAQTTHQGPGSARRGLCAAALRPGNAGVERSAPNQSAGVAEAGGDAVDGNGNAARRASSSIWPARQRRRSSTWRWLRGAM